MRKPLVIWGGSGLVPKNHDNAAFKTLTLSDPPSPLQRGSSGKPVPILTSSALYRFGPGMRRMALTRRANPLAPAPNAQQYLVRVPRYVT